MTKPVKYNLNIIQGGTYTKAFRYELPNKMYAPIENVYTQAPLIIQSSAHGIPSGWRVKLSNILGTVELNKDEYITVTSTTTDTLTFSDINATGYKAYVSGGVIEYNQPRDLTDITARMQIRAKVSSEEVLLELTTENGYLVVDNAQKTISINIPASVTQGLTFKSAVYSMELVDGTIVIPFLTGSVFLDTEVTR